ncbi:glutamate--cysteine ligase family protein [Lolliginicoccus suaedae]|uniref:glutamate--cysteine ligase n=1 Tax=Lolliginicoccus suaedae TaxID=2605429 RepID=UPI0011EE313E|nr:glutamate--cysteine ligase [Lolliginicoccus suaedae]
MGTEVTAIRFTHEDRRVFRRKVHECTEALERMLHDGAFDSHRAVPLLGMEVELNLVDDAMEPAKANDEVLAAIADNDYQTELGRFNIELNVAPAPLAGESIREVELGLRRSLEHADDMASRNGARVVLTGMLPTLRTEHFDAAWITDNPRYALLNEQIFAARGEDIEIDISGNGLDGGAERLRIDCTSVLPEAACTSVQLHLAVDPDMFAAYWNAAQCVAGVQVALGANSPFLAQTALWHESRIPVFEQAIDTRSLELKNQGVRPRVWFGERWITSIFDLFDENARYFPALLPEATDEAPLARLEAGETPSLAELSMHNGTIYRWNRPVYAVVEGTPQIRVENRVLPGGPTVIDTMANAAFYYGVVHALAHADRPAWTQMSFDAARTNLEKAARHGMDARLYWPSCGEVGPDELALRWLLPLAEQGLSDYGVAAEVRDRYLSIIEERCLQRRNGAGWQRRMVARLEKSGMTRQEALPRMLAEYAELMRAGDPVHTWPW